MNYLDLARSAVIGTYATGVAATAVLGRLLYWATVPFRYPAYYLWAVLSFVLSPLWFLVDLVRSSTVWALHLAVRFRYVYIYFACATMIGLLAALVLHGTSSLLFVLLRLHPSQQPAPSASKARPAEPTRRIAGGEEDEDDEYDDLDDFEGGGGGGSSSALDTTATTATTSSSGRTSVATGDPSVVVLRYHRRGGAAGRDRDPPAALYGNHWRALSDHRKAPVKSRHRGKLKGLLAQTIHEESSESESL